MKRLGGLHWTAMFFLIHLLLLTRRLCRACSVHSTCLNGRCWNVLYACYLTRDEARGRCERDYETLATHLTSTEIAHLGFVVASKLLLGDNTLWIDGDVTSSANRAARWYDGTAFTFDHVFYNGSCLRLIAFQQNSYLDTNECDRAQQFICHVSPPLPTTTAEATTVEATTEPETTTPITTEAETTTRTTTTSTTEDTITSAIEDTTITSTTEDTITSAIEDTTTTSTTEDTITSTTEDTTITSTTEDTTTALTTEATTITATSEAETAVASTHQIPTTSDKETTTANTTDIAMTENNSTLVSMLTTAAPNNSTYQYVMTSANKKSLCYCVTCAAAGMTSANAINMTQLPLSEFVLSKKNKGETRPDSRPSAIAIGSVGIGVLVAVAAVIIIPDLPRVVSDVRHAIRHCCCHGNDTDLETAQKRRKR